MKNLWGKFKRWYDRLDVIGLMMFWTVIGLIGVIIVTNIVG